MKKMIKGKLEERTEENDRSKCDHEGKKES
jgi:hypothetical protein